MKPTKRMTGLLGIALGGIALVTTATCDPYSGAFDFFRDDDGFYYDDYYYDDVYVDYYGPPLICDEFGCY